MKSFIANETSYKIDDNKNIKFKTRKNKKTDLTEYYNLLYQYKIDCLVAGIEYNKKYYSDGGLRPEESILFSITLRCHSITKLIYLVLINNVSILFKKLFLFIFTNFWLFSSKFIFFC